MNITSPWLCIFLTLLAPSWAGGQKPHFIRKNERYVLTAEGASHLAGLPLKCADQQFPYKTGVVFADSTLIKSPKEYHPAFYGCFDWHSSAHGHWMLARLLRLYPDMPEASAIRDLLQKHLTYENIQVELRVFRQKENRSFERTYGWAWVMQLQQELLKRHDSLGVQLSANLRPLVDHFSLLYREYLLKLAYPLRVGEHSNLAFGLRLAWDYASAAGDDSLAAAIKTCALRFYKNDVNCPISWEPGGTDFLSPCLEEADLMWRILPPGEYESWLARFLPLLAKPVIPLQPGIVNDRSDGRLVHLDGLNFSRAWCLYGIAAHVKKNGTVITSLANTHMAAALPHVASGDYMGEHWLASFAVYALTATDN